MILFLFGKPGTGKSVIGQGLAKLLGTLYFDCDDCYTDSDMLAIRNNSFTFEESDSFLERVIKKLQEKHQEKGILVTSQSLFREEQRRRLKEEFDGDIFLVYLDIPTETSLYRVASRDREIDKHFYGIEQYLHEVNEYEDVMACDLKIKNIARPDKAIKKIHRKFISYLLKNEINVL